MSVDEVVWQHHYEPERAVHARGVDSVPFTVERCARCGRPAANPVHEVEA